MHDLMRSLAQHLLRDESCFYRNTENLIVASTAPEFKVRRLGCAEKFTVVPEPILYEQKGLRTLLSFGGASTRFDDNGALVRLKYLRVLCLAGSRFESLPDSLGNLVHLILLDLCGTSVSTVPQGIVRLTNLQFLNLSDCKSLHRLPDGITKLCSLRHFILGDTPLSYLPKGIGRLKQLNVLTGFVVGKDILGCNTRDHRCSLEELGSLSQLRHLWIENLERTKLTTRCAIFTNNHHIKKLRLNCEPSSSLTCSEQTVDELQKLFGLLSPPPCLEKLRVSNYFGHNFPDWMMKNSLALLFLDNCTECARLPPFGQLSQLKRLRITRASSVVSIGPELLGIRSRKGNTVAFGKLELLYMADMPNWKEWSLGEEFDMQLSPSGLQLLPCLRQFILNDCPKLRELPNGLRHCSVEKMFITRAHSLERVCHLPGLTRRLDVKECRSLKWISDLPMLGELCITNCPVLVCVERLVSLRKLQLHDGSMEHLPEWLSRPMQQRRAASTYDNLQLEIRCSINVLRRCGEGCPDWSIDHPTISSSERLPVLRNKQFFLYK